MKFLQSDGIKSKLWSNVVIVKVFRSSKRLYLSQSLLQLYMSVSLRHFILMSRLSDDLCKLKEHSENTPGWKRHLPATQLRNDITTLRDSLKSLLMDTYVRGIISFQYIQVFTCLHIDRTQQTPPSLQTPPSIRKYVL